MNKPMSRWLLGISTVLGGLLPWVVQADGDVTAGARKAIYCSYCHGADGNPAAADIPRLAGQDANALLAKMKRQLPNRDRRHPMYQAFVTGDCLNDREMSNLAAYFSGQSATP